MNASQLIGIQVQEEKQTTRTRPSINYDGYNNESLMNYGRNFTRHLGLKNSLRLDKLLMQI